MSEFDKELVIDTDDELERLLSHASPRPMPDDAAELAARRAVHAEWRKATGRKHRRQHVVKFSIAASILVAAFSIFSVFRPATVELVEIASIQKSFGSIHILGKQTAPAPANSLQTIYKGQTIRTGDDAGIALAWSNGGSVRVDKNTEVEFRSDSAVYVKSGKVYFDSHPSELIAGISAGGITPFVVDTEHGSVSHTGTQFMTEVERDELIVSVREGTVSVDGRFSSGVATRGEQLTFAGRQAPVKLDIKEYGAHWAWVGQTSPAIDVNGKSVDDFLRWAARELGYYGVEYADSVEQSSRDAKLVGRIDIAPSEALRARMRTTDLDYSIEGGVIYVISSE